MVTKYSNDDFGAEFLEEESNWEDYDSGRIISKEDGIIAGYDVNINWKINKDAEEIFSTFVSKKIESIMSNGWLLNRNLNRWAMNILRTNMRLEGYQWQMSETVE